jgi:hypothetical protein
MSDRRTPFSQPSPDEADFDFPLVRRQPIRLGQASFGSQAIGESSIRPLPHGTDPSLERPPANARERIQRYSSVPATGKIHAPKPLRQEYPIPPKLKLAIIPIPSPARGA